MAALLMIPETACCQVENVENQIEKTVETLETDNDYHEIAEDFETLASHPVKLNAVREENDLAPIPFITPGQRKDLFDFIRNYGEILSVYELTSIRGFDSLVIRAIEPYISITPPSRSPPFTLKNLASGAHYDLLLRVGQSFPSSAGFLQGDSARASKPDAFYRGSPQHYYFRFAYSWYDKVRIGIAGEKDPGEQFFRGGQPNGMDFYSGYLNLSNVGFLKTLTVGSFRASFGQGLTFGSGISLFSVPGLSMNVPLATGIRPSLGMSEGRNLKGIAATLKFKPFEFSAFVSCHPVDANYPAADSLSKEVKRITSFVTSGYHRSGSELSKRNVAKELICGGNFNLVLSPNQQLGMKFGVTATWFHLSASLDPQSYPYNQYNFRGKENANFGFDYQVRFRRVYLSGEVSRSRNKGMAVIAGACITPDPAVTLTVVYRNYQPDYQNLFGNAFGQNGLNANEKGIYIAFAASLHRKLTLSGYGDLFSFPWLKYRVDNPTLGQELGAILTWRATGNVTISLRYYEKNSQVNQSTENGMILHKLIPQKTNSCRFSIDWILPESLTMKTRIETKYIPGSNVSESCGYLVCQDMQLNLRKWLKNINVRFALFDIRDYAERIYTCEPDVLFGYSVPAMEGRGTRSCLVLKFCILKHLDIWLRGGITRYNDRNQVGTGLDMTKGNFRAEFTGQMMFKM
ncbi:MAG: hypothetical protein WCO44_17105 [Bacteroidota bacterium]